jgi:hypothetical protein
MECEQSSCNILQALGSFGGLSAFVPTVRASVISMCMICSSEKHKHVEICRGKWGQVFRQADIPRRLDDVVDHEKDFKLLAEGGEVEGIYYQGITGMRADMKGARLVPALVERAQLSAAELAHHDR